MIGLSFHKVIKQILREELAIIENRILEKNLAAKKKAEKRAKNIAVSSICSHKTGWQKLRGSTGGTRRKVWTGTKILSPNIRYFVAN